jgi:hypothetical protein
MNRAASNVVTTSPAVAAATGWLLPGLGYWLIGERQRGVTVGVTILLLFFLGIFLGGIRIIDAPPMRGNIVSNLLQKPWFIGQALTGPVGLGSAYISNRIGERPGWRHSAARARLGEIATLYTAIAGMLNLMVMIDCGYRASRMEGRR